MTARDGLPAFEVVARRRALQLARPLPDGGLPHAPYVAVEVDLEGPDAPARLGLASGDVELRAHREDGRVWLELTRGTRTTRHESRRHARAPRADGLALSLTGDLATAWSRDGGRWLARAVLRLDDEHTPGLEAPDVHADDFLADLRVTGAHDRAGVFGQLGLRDPRLVTHADGTAWMEDGLLLLSATSAGPGGFGTGHTSVWSLDPTDLALEHRADLFFRRPSDPPGGRSGVLGDHATHVVRDGDHWLVATSTWGDFDERTNPQVSMTWAHVPSEVDLLRGVHVLDTTALRAPTSGPGLELTSVGTWDPHLVRTEDGWLVAYVSATRFFSFHPVLAEGPDLDSLRLRAAATRRTSCEGPTLLRTPDGWRVLASHGRDGRRDRDGTAATYPVLDLDLHEVGTLDAHFPTNLPWPTLARTGAGPEDWLLIGFDGTAAGGPLLGYGTHGDLVLQRPQAAR